MNDAVSSLQSSAAATFRALHESGCFVLPNPWDIGSAVYLRHLGFQALATTSAGFAFSRGRPDGMAGISLNEQLTHIGEIVAATPLPVNADFQSGYADDAGGVGVNSARCIATGVAGFSIEDNTGREDAPLYEKSVATDRIRAARDAIDTSGIPVLLTGRCEAWLVNDPYPFRVALDRLVAYAEAGADCLYAPGVSDPNEIGEMVRSLAPKPVNILVSGFNRELTVTQLADLGVRRISVGSGLACAAWGGFIRAAHNIATTGKFDAFGAAAAFAEISEVLRARN